MNIHAASAIIFLCLSAIQFVEFLNPEKKKEISTKEEIVACDIVSRGSVDSAVTLVRRAVRKDGNIKVEHWMPVIRSPGYPDMELERITNHPAEDNL